MERGRTQILYNFLPGALAEHEDFGMSWVVSVELDPQVDVNQRALLNLVDDYIRRWEFDGRVFHQGYPANRLNPAGFAIGQPSRVLMEPFPSSFSCARCGYTAKLVSLKRRRSQPGECPRCKGPLGRMTVIQVHNCGTLQELSFPDEYDSKFRGHDLRLFNPGRTRDARWYSLTSNKEIGGLRMWPCSCEYSKAKPDEKFQRQVEAKEPTNHLAHVLPFLNFDREQESLLISLEKSSAGLLLAKLWGLLPGKVREALAKRELSPEAQQLLEELRQVDPERARSIEAQMKNDPSSQALSEVGRLTAGHTIGPPSRHLVEHAILEDTSKLTTAAMVAARWGTLGGFDAESYLQEFEQVRELLGFSNVRLISDFRIALAAIGYTRISRDPQRSILRAFPAVDGKTPIYCVPTETEAIWFQLDPTSVLRWLVHNGLAPKEARGAAAWAELWHLGLRGEAFRAPQAKAPTLVYTLLHTISHLMMQHIVWSGFAPESIGEYLLPDTLGLILYANRYTASKIGGLTTLFEQHLPYWLEEVYQDGRACIYDPLCAEEGGSCVGCTHLEHNCIDFNHHLSRLVLYGGNHPVYGRLRGFWEP